MTPAPLSRRDPWFSAAPTSIAVPHHVPSSTSRNRFNDGSGAFALRYLAPSPIVALLEATALHGAYATGFVGPHRPRSWTIYHYEVVAQLDVVDFADPRVRGQVPTTVQELTGDWLGYHHRSHRALPAFRFGCPRQSFFLAKPRACCTGALPAGCPRIRRAVCQSAARRQLGAVLRLPPARCA